MTTTAPTLPGTGRTRRGFTLMEVVVSIGVLAMALAVIVTSIAFSGNRGAENSRKSQALSLAESAAADVTAALKQELTRSERLGIPPPAAGVEATETVYFDANGVTSDKAKGFYQCRVSYHPDKSINGLTHMHLRVLWPARARPGREEGAVELLSSVKVP
jgi:prepilin-type N-terminal cleavage/methylation domain-containing protein